MPQAQAKHRRIALLGGFQVETEAGDLPIPGGQARHLLAYLILHPHTAHSRDALAELLWPETAPDLARRRLSDLLYRLRNLLGEGWLYSQGDAVALAAPEALQVDVWTFEELSAQDSAEALRAAVALYRGELLPTLYADWILARRTLLHECYLTALERLALLEEAAGRYPQALLRFRQLAELDPLRESVCQGIMRCLARAGRLPEALQEYAALAARLDAELGVPPGEATQELAQRLEREWSLHATPPRPGPSPFVGRVQERRRLLTQLDRAYQNRGGLVVVLGEAGMGKSRLLGELAQAADWRGWQVGWGFAQARLAATPYTPLTQALDGLLSTARVAQLRQLVQPHWLDRLRPLLPALDADGSSAPPADDAQMAETGTLRQDLPVAVIRLLAGLHRIAPHLILLEDVHWADPALWPLLAEIRPALASLGVLLVLSARPGELQRQEAAWHQVLAWDREEDAVLVLDGLTRDEVAELIHLTGHKDATVPPLDRILAEGRGNPLWTLALLEAPHALATEHPDLERLLAHRLTWVDRDHRPFFAAATVLGERFSYTTWEALCAAGGLPVQELPEVAGALERARLLEVDDAHYHFAHQLLWETAHARLNPETRAYWHRLALDVLRQRQSQSPERLLYHALEAGDDLSAAHYALLAGERARAAAAFAQAQAHFRQALALLPPTAGADRYRAWYGLAQMWAILEQREEQVEALAALDALVDVLDEDRRRAQVALLWADHLQARGQADQAYARAQEGLTRAQRADEPSLEAAARLALARLDTQQGRYAAAQRQADQALALYTRLHDRTQVAHTLNFLGHLAMRQGAFQARLEHHRQALALFRRLGDLHGEVQTLAMLGGAHLNLGQLDAARTVHEEALALCAELGDRAGEGRNLSNLGGIAMRMGQIPTALDYYRRALAISRTLGNRVRIGIDLNNLGGAYLSLHRFDQALTCLDEALAIAQEVGFETLAGFVQYCRGQAFLRMDDLAQAQEALSASLEIRQGVGETFNTMIAATALALVAGLRGDLEAGEAALAQALALMDALTDPISADVQLEVWMAGYQVRLAQGREDEALDFLRRARTTLDEWLAEMTPEEQAQVMVEMFQCQHFQAAWARHSHQVTVTLARQDAPTGRPLTPDETVTITWTVAAPDDAAISDRQARRRHVLARLLAEAQAQGGAPTAADLAQALGVSRRTVLRDMRILAEQGLALPLRIPSSAS